MARHPNVRPLRIRELNPRDADGRYADSPRGPIADGQRRRGELRRRIEDLEDALRLKREGISIRGRDELHGRDDGAADGQQSPREPRFKLGDPLVNVGFGGEPLRGRLRRRGVYRGRVRHARSSWRVPARGRRVREVGSRGDGFAASMRPTGDSLTYPVVSCTCLAVGGKPRGNRLGVIGKSSSNQRVAEVGWLPGRDSNPRPSG